MSLQTKRDADAITLQASGEQTATGNGSAVQLPGMANAMAFVFRLTAAADDVGDTLDVFVQTTFDDGTTWVDVAHFTQVNGDTAVVTPPYYVAKVAAGAAETMFENATTLSAGSVRNLLGDKWRARWAIAQGNAVTTTNAATTAAPTTTVAPDAAFTFSVVACPM